MAIQGLTVDVQAKTMTVDHAVVIANQHYYALRENHIHKIRIAGIHYDFNSGNPEVTCIFYDRQGNKHQVAFNITDVYETSAEAKVAVLASYSTDLDTEITNEDVGMP